MDKRLPLFALADEAIDLLDLQYSTFKYVEGVLKKTFQELLESEVHFIELNSRIKAAGSLKEKIIRNKYYLEYGSAQQILDNLPDLIGITLKCRFLSDEKLLYTLICDNFDSTDTGFSSCRTNSELFLNIDDLQPKPEVNGQHSYRLDGYYLYNQKKINFELQIKSLTHSFWSDIEHQIIYKNNQFILADDFMKRIMNSIRESLDIVDSQIKYVSEEVMRQDTLQTNIGLSEYNFKIFLAKAINDIYCEKMKEITQIDTDFRRCSEIISQYIYIHSFLRSNHPQQQMLLYYEQLNYLRDTEIGLTDYIIIDEEVSSDDEFVSHLANHCIRKINNDFDWHAFFVMLFSVQNDFSLEQLIHFIKVIKELYFQPHFYDLLQEKITKDRQQIIIEGLTTTIIDSLIAADSITIFYEENIVDCASILVDFIVAVAMIKNESDVQNMLTELQVRIKHIFQ